MTSQLKKFVELAPEDRRLFLRALFLVAAIRAGLCILPFRVIQRFVSNAGRGPTSTHPLGHCVWAVGASSRYVPGATCLTQALAAQALLTESGYDSRIEIGVNKDDQSRFRAHAWVVCENEIVIGGSEAESYVPLAAWNTTHSTIGRSH